MTQETINKYFQGELGQQCNSLFTTSDDRVFIRYHEAVSHSNENNLDVKLIEEWFEEYSGSDPVPIVRSLPTYPPNSFGIEIEPKIREVMDYIEEKAESRGWENAEYMAGEKYGEDLLRSAIITFEKIHKSKMGISKETDQPIF
jgi:hypothetical protein